MGSIVASVSTSGAVDAGTTLDLHVPNIVQPGDIIIVAIAYIGRPDVSPTYAYIYNDQYASPKLAFLDPEAGDYSIISDGDYYPYFGLSYGYSPGNNSQWGGATPSIFYRRATGDEGNALLSIEIGRGDVPPGYTQIGAFVAMGITVVRGFHWVGDNAELQDGSNEIDYPVPTTPPSGVTPVMLWFFFASWRGTVGPGAVTSGGSWTLEWEETVGSFPGELAAVAFSRIDSASVTDETIAPTSLLDAAWAGLLVALPLISDKLTPVIFAPIVGTTPARTVISTGIDPGGSRRTPTGWYTWPTPKLTKTKPPPLPPYAPDGDDVFRDAT